MLGFSVSLSPRWDLLSSPSVCDVVKNSVVVAGVSAVLLFSPPDAVAISGGGKDYASKDWSGKRARTGRVAVEENRGSVC